MTDFVLFERDGDVVTFTLNRPEERNALSTQAQWDELVDCCARVRADESVKVVILTGAGTAFSAGGNVKDMRDKKGIAGGTPHAIFKGYQGGIQRIPLALHQLEVPTIAAVNGPAIGAGCDLACMCDIRIASDEAKFAESFVKLGIDNLELRCRAHNTLAAEQDFGRDYMDFARGVTSGAAPERR